MGRFVDDLKSLFIAGVGLFGDGFHNISIGLVVPIIGYLYFEDKGGKAPTVSGDAIKAGLSLGMIVGQLLFGVFSDALGRHKIYSKELIITIVATLMVVVAPTNLGHDGIVAWLTVFRIVTGVGIGGDYPLTSSISAERQSASSRAKLVLTLRGLPGQLKDFREYFSDFKHARTLFAVSAAWFLFDIAYYGINLNQSIVLREIGYGAGSTPFETLWNTAVGNIIIVLAGYLPAFYVGIFLPDLMGRVRQQLVFGALAAVLYAIWAGVSDNTSTGGLMTIFAISQFVLNVGPNCTRFLLPVEVFPTRVRATAHGIAAASGKAGAVITAFAFGSIRDRIGISGVLGLFSGIMALLVLVTLWIPETRNVSIAQIEKGLLGEAGNSIFDESRSDETAISSADSVQKSGKGIHDSNTEVHGA
ncbi:hypothetical protein TI39_contig5853g00001 [Zymoseptoria brevis]|uniref:Major facilitator superfamily (MFS) profile domain-containing protein n=1 Tax=Zymoseptoria brevis TaxID=1047168 RepID=A0A0F4G527_9PEZI|nr:hypothetical protein TI39_contig5853g00001 [Zymoseptoria brevis]